MLGCSARHIAMWASRQADRTSDHRDFFYQQVQSFVQYKAARSSSGFSWPCHSHEPFHLEQIRRLRSSLLFASIIELRIECLKLVMQLPFDLMISPFLEFINNITNECGRY
jgi:hypothetical protein